MWVKIQNLLSWSHGRLTRTGGVARGSRAGEQESWVRDTSSGRQLSIQTDGEAAGPSNKGHPSLSAHSWAVIHPEA